jgi:parvulin-like peptidyl-prolyl isomerase
MRRHSLLNRCFILCSVATLGLCGALPAEERPPTDPATVSEADAAPLARVNGEPISESQVSRRLESVHGDLTEYRQDPVRWQRMLEAGLEAEIRDRLLAQAAAAEGLSVSDEEVAAALERSKVMLGEADYQAMLERRGASEAQYRDFLRSRLLIDKYTAKLFADIQVTDAALREYYEGHGELFAVPERARLETLTVHQPEAAARIEKALESGKPFEEVATQQAASSDGEDGVVKIWVGIADLPDSYRDAIAAAAPGEVIGPVEEAGATRFIEVREKQPAGTLTFDETKERLRASFLNRRQQRALDDWYQAAAKAADIEYSAER